jgi:hypothetical protein
LLDIWPLKIARRRIILPRALLGDCPHEERQIVHGIRQGPGHGLDTAHQRHRVEVMCLPSERYAVGRGLEAVSAAAERRDADGAGNVSANAEGGAPEPDEGSFAAGRPARC